jgi:hypothetical protein
MKDKNRRHDRKIDDPYAKKKSSTDRYIKTDDTKKNMNNHREELDQALSKTVRQAKYTSRTPHGASLRKQ